MNVELFPFQKNAVADLRYKVNRAMESYKATYAPQVVSLQAPTGSGKTVMMSALIEAVLYGDVRYDEQPDAVFVWLSDSPQLNEQSKAKILEKCDRIALTQVVTIEEGSFDRETLEDGHIYFLNTQKLGRAGRLVRHSETQRWTIWETLANTVREKGGRLYFVIDEAHRGMLGREAGRATTIMQTFLKGCPELGLAAPMPVVVGMSATPERFTRLVGGISSTLHTVVVSPNDVRASGLLKDRIIVSYPEDPAKEDDFAVLAAATREWMHKCEHWAGYCRNQHYRSVDPVFVVQVKSGSGETVSETDLDAVVAKIEETRGVPFTAGEVVHTFGTGGELTLNGHVVKPVEPSRIAEDRSVKVVLFKESLTTGWDCPRAETMMSFRKAEDATYIAQLLGRMVRTPLQCHVTVDDSLNDVKLFLPYFNRENVDDVVKELKSSECGEIPSDITSSWIGTNVLWGIHRKAPVEDPRQQVLPLETVEQPPAGPVVQTADVPSSSAADASTGQTAPVMPTAASTVQQSGIATGHPARPAAPVQPELPMDIDRTAILAAVNAMGILTYAVRTEAQHVGDYLASVFQLAGLLTRTGIRANAMDDLKTEITDIIHAAIEEMKASGRYADAARKVTEFKLAATVFDGLGDRVETYAQTLMAFTSETDIDRQLRQADARMGRNGVVYEYGRRFMDEDDEDAFKVECIVFAKDEVGLGRIHDYAKGKYHTWIDEYRMSLTGRDEATRREYDAIATNGDPVSKHNLVLPETIHGIADPNGKIYCDHLYGDEDGQAQIKLNSIEAAVIAEEERRDDFVCWIRNQPRMSWALCVPYEMNGEKKGFYPDFLVVRRSAETASGYVIDILEPHGDQFADNLPKAKGLAAYAQVESRLGRIELIHTDQGMGGTVQFKRLDLNRLQLRNKVLTLVSDQDLHRLFEQ